LSSLGRVAWHVYTHLKALGQGKVLKKTALKNIKRGKSYRQKCADFGPILDQF
jgi:hypothetical protein